MQGKGGGAWAFRVGGTLAIDGTGHGSELPGNSPEESVMLHTDLPQLFGGLVVRQLEADCALVVLQLGHRERLAQVSVYCKYRLLCTGTCKNALKNNERNGSEYQTRTIKSSTIAVIKANSYTVIDLLACILHTLHGSQSPLVCECVCEWVNERQKL